MMLTMTSWRGLSVWMNLLIDDSMSWPAGLRCLGVPMEVGAAGRAVRSRAFSTRRRTAGQPHPVGQWPSGSHGCRRMSRPDWASARSLLRAKTVRSRTSPSSVIWKVSARTSPSKGGRGHALPPLPPEPSVAPPRGSRPPQPGCGMPLRCWRRRCSRRAGGSRWRAARSTYYYQRGHVHALTQAARIGGGAAGAPLHRRALASLRSMAFTVPST